MNYVNSPIEKIKYNNKNYFIKRDDLLDENFSGNKARKFYYYLKNDFPNITKVVSHGSAQSNAMYSLSVLCKLKNWDFEYYVDHIASFIKENPVGNYKAALKNGMKIFEEEIPKTFEESTLFISEGGAVKEASLGIKLLAQEIIDWAEVTKQENLKIFLPSGTGTTALYLQKYLPFEVITCPCVGDGEYLKNQFNKLETSNHPRIIDLAKKYHFGKLYKEFYEVYKELLSQTNIEFDFLYDLKAWICIDSLLQKNKNILYIHQGGLLGNESMILRYQYKYDRIIKK